MDTGNVAVIMFFTATVLPVYFILRFIYKSKKEKYDMVKHAITNHYPNAHLLLSKGYGRKQAAYISSVKQIAVAVALLVPCCFEIDNDLRIVLLSVGLFLLFYGIGMLPITALKEKKPDEPGAKEAEITEKTGQDGNGENSETTVAAADKN